MVLFSPVVPCISMFNLWNGLSLIACFILHSKPLNSLWILKKKKKMWENRDFSFFLHPLYSSLLNSAPQVLSVLPSFHTPIKSLFPDSPKSKFQELGCPGAVSRPGVQAFQNVPQRSAKRLTVFFREFGIYNQNGVKAVIANVHFSFT